MKPDFPKVYCPLCRTVASATCDTVPAAAALVEVEGGLAYEGSSDVDWDGQRTDRAGGLTMFWCGECDAAFGATLPEAADRTEDAPERREDGECPVCRDGVVGACVCTATERAEATFHAVERMIRMDDALKQLICILAVSGWNKLDDGVSVGPLRDVDGAKRLVARIFRTATWNRATFTVRGAEARAFFRLYRKAAGTEPSNPSRPWE
jgi:hypothetical protein